MSKENITFRIDSDRKAALDAMPSLRDATRTAGYAYAFGIKRDHRSYILNEAVATYLEMYQWQIEEIQKGIAEADAGDFASDEEIKATFARLTNAY
ncbi:MAG: CopG family transcriptional regulator [Nostoc sp.]|uniref:CopG family ribbon-helix-helix protein n=1 Tax=Nostoc sp. TaxID=1180 RepID=UPI002FF5A0B4